MPCKLMKKKGYVFDMQAFFKIRNKMHRVKENLKVTWEEPAGRGRRSFLGGIL